VKKRKSAAAIAYDTTKDKAPRIAASGMGHIAERIIEIATAAGIPVREDPALAEVLARIEPGGEIPPETYRAVAEILVFFYRLDLERKGIVKK
jgi:flagellar biosynthesis protein